MTPTELYLQHGELAGIDPATLVLAPDEHTAFAEDHNGTAIYMRLVGDGVKWVKGPQVFALPADPGLIQGSADLAQLSADVGELPDAAQRRAVALALSMIAAAQLEH